MKSRQPTWRAEQKILDYINTNTDTFLFSSKMCIRDRALAVCAVGFVCAIVAELAATAGMSLIDWEAEWAESGTAMAVGMVAAAAVAIIALLVIKKNAGKKAAVN